MRVPIPDDWDGESWTCYQIQWPDSVLWQGILVGLLTMPNRGRYWDERTGSILDVKSVAMAIFSRNYPYIQCGDRNETQGQEPVICFSGGSDCDSDDEYTGECLMGCSIPYGSLRWNNGVLQFRYCGEWYDVEGSPAIDTPITPDNYTPPEIDGGGYSACGQATAVVEMVRQVITSIWDERNNSFWQWWGHVKGDCPGIGLDAKWIVVACQGAVDIMLAEIASAGGYEPDPFDESTWQSVLCALARDFSTSEVGIINGNDIRSKLQSYFASEWGFDLLVNAMFVDALRGINRETFEEYALMGASYDEGDCECPTESEPLLYATEPDANGWYLGLPLEWTYTYGTAKEDGYNRQYPVAAHDVYGAFYACDNMGGDFQRWARNGSDATGTFDFNLTLGGTADTLANARLLTQFPAGATLDALVAALASGRTVTSSSQGARSDVIASPIASAGDTLLVSLFAQANSGTGTAAFKCWLIHNINSASHQ